MDTKYTITESQLMTLTRQHPERYTLREIAYLTDKDKYVVWDGNSWVDLPKGTEEAEAGSLKMNLYELNKNIMAQLPILTDYTNAKITLNNFNKKQTYMLLCKDISYFTIFQYDDVCESCEFSNEVLECVKDIGQMVSIDLTEDKNAVEIWVRTAEDEILCMYLFNCEQMFVYYGG